MTDKNPTNPIEISLPADAVSRLGLTAMTLDWPLAGVALTEERWNNLGIPKPDINNVSTRVCIKDTEKRYTLVRPDTLHPYYLVPYYAPPEQNESLSKAAAEFIVDRVTRFFYTAEPELDVAWTHQDILEKKKEFENCSDPDKREVKARHLVGAMVRRIARLAEVNSNRNTRSMRIDLSREQLSALSEAEGLAARLFQIRSGLLQTENVVEQEKQLRQEIRETLKPITNEFVEYYKFLISICPEPHHAADHSRSIVHAVRLRDFSEDTDGVLEHLIREMGKMITFEMSQENARANLLHHIGQAMGAIDEAHAALKRMTDSKKISIVFNNALKDYKDSLPEESVALRSLASLSIDTLVNKYTEIARARTGVKSDDANCFSDLREEADLIRKVLTETSQKLRQHIQEASMPVEKEGAAKKLQKQRENIDGLAILGMLDRFQQGLELIASMSQSRIPRNRHAPGFFDKGISSQPGQDDPKDQSSVRNFERKVAQWLEQQKSRSTPSRSV